MTRKAEDARDYTVHSSALQIAISALAVVVFCGLLVFDLNRVAKSARSTGDAILVTISIYLDALNPFVALLRIFGLFGSNKDACDVTREGTPCSST